MNDEPIFIDLILVVEVYNQVNIEGLGGFKVYLML